MSKKNSLSRRKNQYEFDLRREKAERDKKAMKLKTKSSKMKVDGTKKKIKRGFKVGKKKIKTKMSASTKAEIAQSMQVDK
ncbi:hypothetical protein ZOSMA_37G01040 [Zostera marina]|uniref:Uncharacterized protein n=1 Tax=Zostera marina TaxID=29655 RepID=A0A0K9P7L2_ZOSMR|nr:hypothetical protein ZOSMA_37G01040 [Zostera marina]